MGETEPPPELRIAARPPTEIGPGEAAGQIGAFAPYAQTPDHIVTFDAPTAGPHPRPSQRVRRHRDWIAIDETNEQGTGAERIHLPTGVVLRSAGDLTAARTYLSIAAPERSSGIDHRSFKTRESRRVRGELCDVWDVYRNAEPPPRWSHRSCVARDGVELAHSSMGSPSEWEDAVSISRRKVAASEARPDPNLLDLAAWIEASKPPASASPGPRDFEVVLKPVAAEVSPNGRPREAIVIRRHHPWRSETEVRPDGGGTFRSSQEGFMLDIFASFGPGGTPERLILERRAEPSSTPAERPTQSPLKQDAEIILGLKCRWIDMMPGVMDAGRMDCVTEDGLTLARRETSWGTSRAYVAVRIDRRPLRLDEVTPPPEVLSLNMWGVAR